MPDGAPPTPSPPAAERRGRGDVEVHEPTRAQQVVARRTAESRATVPDFSLAVDVDMEACAELRDGATPPPTFDDMVVRASALALRAFPRANGAYRDGRFELHSRVNVGVAIAAGDALVAPTLFDADRKALREIAAETRALAERAQAGTLQAPELSGATFSVSSLGAFGVARLTPVITPPQAAILGVGAVEPRAVVRDGAVVARRTVTLTLVCDHRILYGAAAAAFLARIRAELEQPGALAG